MKRSFAATAWREGKAYVSQCLELDIASRGETEEEALANLKEALELHFEPPQATRPPRLRTVEVEVGRLRPQPFREVKRRLEIEPNDWEQRGPRAALQIGQTIREIEFEFGSRSVIDVIRPGPSHGWRGILKGW